MSGNLIRDPQSHELQAGFGNLTEDAIFPTHSGFNPYSFPIERRLYPLSYTLNKIIKRIIDITAAFLLLIVCLPLLPIIATLIAFDSRGPIFFKQQRNKLNGETFCCFKFRTMIPNAEADIFAAEKNDKRITRIGALLRKSHADELPQLINVLFGDMSMIGPRPHMLADNEKFENIVTNYNERHYVKPGITGLAQVLGYVGPVTNAEELRERIEQDLYYVKNWSLRLDLMIFFKTAKQIFSFLNRKE